MKYVVIVLALLYGGDLVAQFRSDSLKHSPSTFDERLFWELNHSADTSRFLDNTMLFASRSLLPVAIATPLAEVGIGYATADDDYFFDACGLAAGTLGTIVFQELIVKPIVQRPRPFKSLEGVRWVDSSAHGYSFPSSHAAISFGLATALSLRYPTPWVIVPAYAYAFIVSISRPYLGVHYPSDILCGAIIG
ncbi:MAG TPA: phosphatase PAP2 family protein, partial [Candidatus Kapabacteria bacterium]|nr:phosphatase PAP2 family protein [Candidatus Kapabacteria bacterium]